MSVFPPLYPVLNDFIQGLLPPRPDQEREEVLLQIATWIKMKQTLGQVANLVFICTHNSRRSHLAQVWMATLLAYYQQDSIKTFSGGTEATAFYPEAVATLGRSGFRVASSEGNNPRFLLHYADTASPLICFSKVYDDPSNPAKDFAAVMVCSDADENCPFIPGAAARFSLPYKDPKIADFTPDVSSVYDERSREIATEMHFILQNCLKHD